MTVTDVVIVVVLAGVVAEVVGVFLGWNEPWI